MHALLQLIPVCCLHNLGDSDGDDDCGILFCGVVLSCFPG